MNIRTTALAGLLVAALPLAASATAPRYTYLGAGYVTTDQAGDGYGFEGSTSVLPWLHAFGGYSITRDNFGGSLYAETSQYNFGLGVNYALKPNLDAVGRVSYTHTKCYTLDYNCYLTGDYSNGGSTSKNGMGLEALLRWTPTDRVEIDGGALRNNGFGSFDATTRLEVGAWYDVIKNLAVGGQLYYGGSSDNIYAIGARYYFGKGLGDLIK